MRISDWSSDVCSSDLHRFTQDRRRDTELAAPPLAGRRAYLWHVSGIPYWRDRFAATGRHALGRVTEDFVPAALSSEKRREGKECVSTCRFRWGASRSKNNQTTHREKDDETTYL